MLACACLVDAWVWVRCFANREEKRTRQEVEEEDRV